MKRKKADDDIDLELRKKRTRECPGQPLPVPLESITGQPPSNFIWKCYHARLLIGGKESKFGRKNYVVVSNKEDIKSLRTHGYFGTITFKNVDSEPEYKIDSWVPGLDFCKPGSDNTNQEWHQDEQFWNQDKDKSPDKNHIDRQDKSTNNVNERSNNDETSNKDDDPNNHQIIDIHNDDETSNKDEDPSNNQTIDIRNDDDESTDDEPTCWAQVAKYNQKVSTTDICLELELCEAFYLSYVIGCLVVTNEEDEKEMNLVEMWNNYIKLETDFAYRYGVYHHCRSRGWVVRSGYSLGCDWLLYKLGPPFYHATFTVRVEVVDGESGKLEKTIPPLTWTDVLAFNRMNKNVNKKLLLARVEMNNVQPQDWQSPHLINKMGISLKRLFFWQPREMRWDEKPQVPVQP